MWWQQLGGQPTALLRHLSPGPTGCQRSLLFSHAMRQAERVFTAPPGSIYTESRTRMTAGALVPVIRIPPSGRIHVAGASDPVRAREPVKRPILEKGPVSFQKTGRRSCLRPRRNPRRSAADGRRPRRTAPPRRPATRRHRRKAARCRCHR